MTTLVFGIGIGLFLILSLWLIAALVLLVSLRVERKIGFLAIIIVIAITIILTSIPRSSEEKRIAGNKPYDKFFIWRIVYLVFLSISSIVGLLAYVKFKYTEPIRPVVISSWVF